MNSIFVCVAFLLTGRAWAEEAGDNPSTGTNDARVRFKKNILLENREVGILEIHENQEPADAIYNFGKQHGLDATHRSNILDNICISLSCTRKTALLWSILVDSGNDVQELFRLYEGTEPADAVHEFVTRHNLSKEHHDVIMTRACAVVECNRLEPVIWRKTVNVDGKWDARIEILRGQEPADVIYSALKPYGVGFEGRQKLFQEIKGRIPYTREHALVFSQNIVLEGDESFSEKFVLYDDGKEPVDAIYDFAKTHSIESHFESMAKALLPKVCELALCKRERPSVWQNPIVDEGKQLGVLDILLGDEPIDIIDKFVQRIRAATSDQISYRQKLLVEVCKSIKCTRSTPIVYRKSIKNENGQKIGDVEILENQEVIDGTSQFIRKSGAKVDEIALKNYMLQDACRNSRVKCTRNVAVIFTKKLQREDGSPINTLTIYENEEPADKIYQFCQENASMDYLEGIISKVCDSEGVKCARRDPVYFSIAISGPEGEFIDSFQIKVNEEPVDANGLFKKKWDFDGLVNQICEKPNVECRRRVPLKYFDRNFTMGGIPIGQLEIWGNQEVVDVLYNIRRHYNLTVDEQRASFSDICHRDTVYCERTQAVVFKKTGITKLDYEKFGNETCKRQFVGVKFRSSFVNLPFGGKLAEFLKKDSSKKVVEHPLFCMLILLVLQVTLRFITAIPYVRKKINPFQRAIISFWIIVLVSVLQAVLVEPDVAVDEAMHTFEGKLPDLVIFEGEEPVDALVKWSKEAAKVGTEAAAKQEDWRPIVREPIYWEILDELCSKTEGLTCTRQRAWEFLNMGAMTYFGQEYPIDIYNPEVDPISRKKCLPASEGEPNPCVEASAQEFCDRLWPQPTNCVKDIANHISSQLEMIDSKRLDAKCSYKRLGLESDAPGRELYKKAAAVARSRGMNISPFRRVDNGKNDKFSIVNFDDETILIRC
eukprot:CCRYP_006482-RA/>CCRYP_006482-RA protein AED:0.06 eAED:0.03 QI:0/0/0/1/1/1/5/0/940